jgi:hypothetical protein
MGAAAIGSSASASAMTLTRSRSLSGYLDSLVEDYLDSLRRLSMFSDAGVEAVVSQ